jgi:hypothetical protein
MEKKPRANDNTEPKLSKAALYALFVKPRYITFRKGEKVRGFLI